MFERTRREFLNLLLTLWPWWLIMTMSTYSHLKRMCWDWGCLSRKASKSTENMSSLCFFVDNNLLALYSGAKIRVSILNTFILYWNLFIFIYLFFMYICMHTHNIFKWRCTHTVLKYKQQNPKSYIKRLNITYNTGLGQPRVGSWGRGRIIWRLCTQLVVGREGISVNNSDSLHNTGPQERVMELMYKQTPTLFHTQSNLAGTQKDCGFVLMTGPHQAAATPPSPRNSPATTPPSLSGSWPFANPQPEAWSGHPPSHD